MEDEINLQLLFWTGTILMCFTIITVVMVVVNYQRSVAKQKKEEAERLIKVILDTEQKERQRVAMDLHDEVLGDLNAILIYLRRIQEEPVTPEVIRQLLLTNHQLLYSIQNIQSISYNLMPPELEVLGLLVALEEYFKRVALFYTIDIHFIPAVSRIQVKKRYKYEVFRVIQELTNNIVKHGQAKRIKCEVKSSSDLTDFLIEDDGKSYSFFEALKQSKGLGLRNIVSRTQYLGGEVVHSSLEKGNLIHLKIPHSA